MFVWAACLLLSLVLAACGTIDETQVPAELTPVETTLEVEIPWSQSIGSGVDERYLKLRPVLVRDTLYAADALGSVSATRVAEGERVWEQSLDVAILAGLKRGAGALFLGTEDGMVIALRQRDGGVLWREQFGAEITALSNPSLGVVVVRTADSELYGLDSRSGEPLWQAGRTTPVLTLRGASEPVADSGRVVVGFDDGNLLALSPTRGDVLWTTTIANPSGTTELERLVDIDGEIKVVDGVIYVAAFHGRVAAVTLSQGHILWSRRLSSHMGVAVDAERVYVTDADGYVWALDRINGATLWKQEKLKNRNVTAPVVIDDYLMVGDFEGYTHWLSKHDGHFVARVQTDGAGILATPLVAGDTAYVLHRSGELAALSIPVTEDDQPATDEGILPTLDEELPSLK